MRATRRDLQERLSDPVPVKSKSAARAGEGVVGRISRDLDMIGDRPLLALRRELSPAAAGDVLAAHELARSLLRPLAAAPEAATHDARVLLTASVLYLQSRCDRPPGVRDLLGLLVDFASGVCAAQTFAASPMQFLQFAGAEFEILGPPERLAALRLSLTAVGRALSPRRERRDDA